MRNQEKDAAEMASKRERILEAGFRLFSQKSIPIVTMNDVADACGVGVATVYRYYKTKPALVLAVNTWLWDNYARKNMQILNETEKSQKTALEKYEFFVDTFIDLFRYNKDMLRFNQLFNIYVRSEQLPADQIGAYNHMITQMSGRFQENVLGNRDDGTIRQDVSGQDIFSATLHLMLAATTRYAFGLVYTPEGGAEEERELLMLKRMLVSEFSAKGKCNLSPQTDQRQEESPPKDVKMK